MHQQQQQQHATLAEVEATLQPYVGGLRLLGQWSLPGGGRRLASLCAVLLAHGLLITTSCLNLLMDPPRDLQVLTVNAHSTLTVLGLAVKVVSFSLDGARLRKLLQLLAEARAAFPDSAARCRTTTYSSASQSHHRARSDTAQLLFLL
ncbi:uncharacterized protein LOC126204221 [Schistocerca nitens]|uniref:uncharacterized protein LOC126204221 n=1 Tax=Schistocerca nitens TaxID=7011 RepID=UPI002119071B|nr:uncharacterized protein LOC126204221 [Schistocerca nitens]